MITFLFGVLVCVFLASFWHFIIEYCIAIEYGQSTLGKEEFKRRSEPIKRAYINFLEEFNPALKKIDDRAELIAIVLVALTFVAPIFTFVSLVCMIFQI